MTSETPITNEQLALEEGLLTPEVAQAWLQAADSHLDHPLALRRDPDGVKEYWKLHDVVNKRITLDDGTTVRLPVAVLQSGEIEDEVPVTELLRWQLNAPEQMPDFTKSVLEEALRSRRQELITDADKEEGASGDKKFETETSATMFFLEEVSSLFQIIDAAKARPDRPRVKHIAEKDYESFKSSLEGLAIVATEPTEDQIKEGIERAKAKIVNGTAADELAGMPFMDEKTRRELHSNEVLDRVELDKPVYIDSSLIQGAEGLSSWMGRGHQGQEHVKHRQTGEVRTSLETILDYASRESQLPGLTGDGELEIVITDKGPVLLANNAHRVAAAKLRGEPLRVTNFVFRKTKAMTNIPGSQSSTELSVQEEGDKSGKPQEFVDPEVVDWDKLKDGEFKVRRSDGRVETGWSINKILSIKDHETGQTKEIAVITGWDRSKGGAVEKTVELSKLLSWQE